MQHSHITAKEGNAKPKRQRKCHIHRTQPTYATSSGRDTARKCLIPGSDPGFLERGFICIKVWGFFLLILSYVSYISHVNEMIVLIILQKYMYLQENYNLFLETASTRQADIGSMVTGRFPHCIKLFLICHKEVHVFI